MKKIITIIKIIKVIKPIKSTTINPTKSNKFIPISPFDKPPTKYPNGQK
jgi:hypothetical protein